MPPGVEIKRLSRIEIFRVGCIINTDSTAAITNDINMLTKKPHKNKKTPPSQMLRVPTPLLIGSSEAITATQARAYKCSASGVTRVDIRY